MTYPHRPAGASPAQPVSQTRGPQWTARKPTNPTPTTVPMRRYEALALMPDGSLSEVVQRAPALKCFESAFVAMARGTLLASEDGPVAVEDLLPGMRVETRDAGFQTVMWVGTTGLAAQTPLAHMPARLFRVPVDSFGPSRPMPDLMLAPHARLLHRSSKLRNLSPDEAALTPITAFEDGYSVIRVAPVSPVNTYHIAFKEHHILRANGLEVESYHPGSDITRQIGGESLRQFLSLFPHIQSLADFGPLVAPRLSVEEYENVMAA